VVALVAEILHHLSRPLLDKVVQDGHRSFTEQNLLELVIERRPAMYASGREPRSGRRSQSRNSFFGNTCCALVATAATAFAPNMSKPCRRRRPDTQHGAPLPCLHQPTY
jgi:hypothetical protein